MGGVGSPGSNLLKAIHIPGKLFEASKLQQKLFVFAKYSYWTIIRVKHYLQTRFMDEDLIASLAAQQKT